MRNKIRPYLSFLAVLIFLVNSIPVSLLESRAYEREGDYLVSGNIVDGEREPESPEPETETVSENIPVEDEPAVSANIIINCSNPHMGTIQVFSGDEELFPIDSRYSFAKGETIRILATPYEYYQVVKDGRGDMKLVNEETGACEMILENFDAEREVDFTIEFEKIKSVTISYDGESMKIGRNMQGGTVSSASLDGQAGYVRITPDYGNKYYAQLDLDVLEECQENIYKIKETKIPADTSVIFYQDQIPPEITFSISSNFIDGTWYINKTSELFIKATDKESGLKNVRTLNGFFEEPKVSGNDLYSLEVRYINFGENNLKRKLEIEAEDMCGNVSCNSIDIVYDKKPPEIKNVSVNSTGRVFKQNNKNYFKPEGTLNISLDVKDDFMLDHWNYKVYANKDKEVFACGEEKAVSEASVPGRVSIEMEEFDTGIYTICLTATDMAGNKSVPETMEIYIDGTSPEIEIKNKDSGEKWYRNWEDIAVEAAISDEYTSDGLSYSYKVIPLNNNIRLSEVDDFIKRKAIKPDTWTCLGVSGNGLEPYQVSISANDIDDIDVDDKNGSYALLIWARDGCHNESEPQSYVFHYDDARPEGINNVTFKINGLEIDGSAITPFGNFLSNQKVEISIEAKDVNEESKNYCDGINPGIEEVFFCYSEVNDENNKSILGVHKGLLVDKDNLDQIPVINQFHKIGTNFTATTEVLKEGVPYKIFLVIKDKAGNSYRCKLEDMQKYESSLVMVDQQGPEVNFSINDEFKNPDYRETVGGTKKEWYRGNHAVIFTLTLEDLYSGLSNWEVTVNDEEKWSGNFRASEPEKNEKQTRSSKQIDLSRGRIRPDGSYTFGAVAHDNAGNESDSDMISKTIYVDEHVPVITSIGFSPNIKDGMENASTPQIQYSFFFKKPIKIKATATDFIGDSKNLGSGIKSVSYELVDSEGKKVKNGKGDLGVTRNEEDDSYIATGPVNEISDFKGKILISAMDNTGQSSDSVSSKGIVIESAKEHKKHSSADIKMKSTPYKDANGNPLYDSMPIITFKAEDTLSGIAENTWNVKAVTSHGAEESGKQAIGLQSGNNGKKSINGWKFSKQEQNLVTKVTKNHKVNSEKNSLVASLNLTDNAGHEKKAVQKVFSVDETDPEVFVEYDNNEAYNEKFYNKERYATIHVIDANFSAEACEIKTTGPEVTKSEWEHIAGSSCNGKIHSKDCEYVCRVGFVADGDYTFGFECTDLAGRSGSYGQVDDFTIDMTEPVIQVSYDNQNSQNGNYYKASRTATVQIEEHNFSPEDVSITMTAMDGGRAIAVPAVVGWSQNEDIHTATIAYDYDGEFTFDIEYTDLASNQAQEYEQDRFIIDITEPEIEIAGVADRSANKGKVQPVVTCKDTNLEDVAISLKGANRGTVKADYDTSRTGSSMVYKFKDLERLENNDDIYTLHVTAKDKAGNELEEEILYSVNRFGSVYEYDRQTEALVKDYYASKCEDLIIKEVNVNTLKVNRITYSKDGEIVTLKEGKDYKLSQSGDEFTWKEYIYTIYKENFEEEGKYILTLYSKDQADNQSDNKIKGKDIEFVIDKTAPSLVLSGVKDGGQYNEDSMELVVNVEDNMGLSGLEVYNDGITIADFDGAAVEEAEGTLRIPLQSKNDWQELVVVTRDMAGNESRSEKISYLMTTNLFVQWYKNPWLFYGSMVIVLLLAGITEYFIRLRKGQRKKRMVG
ncbi:MAG: hypothetical protein NC412_07965 [Roseburia sp.]|nr:hypothetical protein [Roseburia sp.]MCM1278644.1 hypothetical protein [Robinsoniella sp.]